jgi:phosphomevalonate kinase
VPGAGGYDAISLLIEDKAETVEGLQKVLTSWKFKGEGGEEGKVSMLGVREEMQGVREEAAQNYEEWVIKQ